MLSPETKFQLLYYVLPCVMLLIVAYICDRREKKQTKDEPKKNTFKK